MSCESKLSDKGKRIIDGKDLVVEEFIDVF